MVYGLLCPPVTSHTVFRQTIGYGIKVLEAVSLSGLLTVQGECSFKCVLKKCSGNHLAKLMY